LVVLAMISAALLLIVSRGRPLWPVDATLNLVQRLNPGFKGIQTVRATYTFSREYPRQLTGLLGHLPAGEKTIGYFTGLGGTEPCLWQPYGSRRVFRVRWDDDLALLQSWGVRYVVVDRSAPMGSHGSLGNWLNRLNGEIITRVTVWEDPKSPSSNAFLVRIPPALNPPSAP
jgi:hypothetical protein